MKDPAFLPNTFGTRFVRAFVAVHTPLMTAGVAPNNFANCLHSADGCRGCIPER